MPGRGLTPDSIRRLERLLRDVRGAADAMDPIEPGGTIAPFEVRRCELAEPLTQGGGSGDNTAQAYQVLYDDDGTEIVDYDSETFEVRDPRQRLVGKAGDRFLCAKLHDVEWWDLLESAEILWAKVQSISWTPPADGSSERSVTVKLCAHDGTGVSGDSFTVYTPLRPRSYLDLEPDDVVGCYQFPGRKLIITDIWSESGSTPSWQLRVKEDDDTPNVKPTETLIFDHYQFSLTNPVAGDAKAVLVQLIGSSVGQQQWGKVATSFTNATGAASYAVTVDRCTYTGTLKGGQVTVHTPLRPNKDTALFTGYVVGYVQDADGNLVINSDCFDDPIGTIKAWDTNRAVPDGWVELTAAEDRVLKGKTGDEAVGDTGGQWTHTHYEHTLKIADHASHSHSITIDSGGSHSHSITVDSGGGHDHGGSTGSGGADHTHTFTTDAGGGHDHTASAGNAGGHSHTITVDAAAGHDHTASSGLSGGHSHSGTTASDGAHTHTFTTDAAGGHDHGGSTGSGGGSGTTDSATTGVTISSHADHRHEIPLDVMYVGEGTVEINVVSAQYTGYNDPTPLTHTTNDSGHTHTLSGLSHTHTISSVAAHSHGGTSGSAGQHTHSFSAGSVGDHSHTVTVDTGGGHSHTASASAAADHAHSITVDAAAGHTHTGSTAAGGASHTHTIPADAGHTHTGSAASGGAHTHTGSAAAAAAMSHDTTGTDLTHNAADHHPKYYVVRWIKRVN